MPTSYRKDLIGELQKLQIKTFVIRLFGCHMEILIENLSNLQQSNFHRSADFHLPIFFNLP